MVESVKFRNLVTGKEIAMDSDKGDYLLDVDDGSVDWGEVEAKHNTYNFPTQIGSYISSTSLEDREVSFFGYSSKTAWKKENSLKSRRTRIYRSPSGTPLPAITLMTISTTTRRLSG